MEKYKEIERSIITTYRKDIWSKFVKAVKEYELIKNMDYKKSIPIIDNKLVVKEIKTDKELKKL